MTQSAAIVGAGLIGRLIALQLHQSGWKVTLFDKDTPDARQSCTYTGAGMLSPYSELDFAESVIFHLGCDSLKLWPAILNQLLDPVFFQKEGTLVVSHVQDQPELARFESSLRSKCTEPDVIQSVTASDIAQIEPALSGRFTHGIYLPKEGQIDNRQLLSALSRAIVTKGIDWQWGEPIEHLESWSEGKNYDWLIDCRGLGARPDWSSLRGVRGEIVTVEAPDVTLNRPVRLMHPRYALYVVPREDHRFLIGATSIESEDMRPITVQSALELLSAAFSLHPGFAEATISEMQVNCRPALSDNLPQIQVGQGIMRINGLYRHGFLMSPKLCDLATACLLGNMDKIEAQYQPILKIDQEVQDVATSR